MFNWIKSLIGTHVGTKGASVAMVNESKTRARGTVLTENQRTVIHVTGKNAAEVKAEIDRMSDRSARRN